MVETQKVKSSIFLKLIVLIFLLSCNDITSYAHSDSDFSGWSLSGRVINQARVPVKQAALTLQTEGKNYLRYTNEKGFFSFELEEKNAPLELSLSSKKLGWATTKIQKYWLEGRQNIVILQERIVKKKYSVTAPQINLQGVQPYSKIKDDLTLRLNAQAAAGQKITWLRLGLDNGKFFEQKQIDNFNYLLSSDQLPLHAHNVLYSEALDDNNNRTRLYLPLKRILPARNELPAPATSKETLLNIRAQVRASQSTKTEADSQYPPYVFLSVAKVDPDIEGILIKRWDSKGHLSEFYSSETSSKNFTFFDRSAILKENNNYKYSVAYDGQKSSPFGPLVSVKLLPKYQLILLDPADETVVNSGSNILFRWKYQLNEKLLPSGVNRYESLLVYRSDLLEKVVEQASFKKSLGSKTNTLSLALTSFQPSLTYIWTVSSLLRLSEGSESHDQYWNIISDTSPSLMQNISTSGFFNLTREVNR